MTHVKNKLYILLLCIESLDMYNEDNNHHIHTKICSIRTLIHNNQKAYINGKHNYITYNNFLTLILDNINKIVIKKDIQNKIIKILNNYSLENHKLNHKNLISYQYFRRFIYKYRNYQLKDNNQHHTNTDEVYKISLINLYLLYKLTSQKNTYCLYQFLSKS